MSAEVCLPISKPWSYRQPKFLHRHQPPKRELVAKATDKDVNELIAELVLAFVVGPQKSSPMTRFQTGVSLFTLMQPLMKTPLAIGPPSTCAYANEGDLKFPFSTSIAFDDENEMDFEMVESSDFEDGFVMVENPSPNTSNGQLVVHPDFDNFEYQNCELLAAVEASIDPLKQKMFKMAPHFVIPRNRVFQTSNGTCALASASECMINKKATALNYQVPPTIAAGTDLDKTDDEIDLQISVQDGDEDLLQRYAQMSSLEAIANAIVDATQASGQGRKFFIQKIIRGLHPDKQTGNVGNKIIAERVAKIANTIKNYFTDKDLWGRPAEWRSHIKYLSRDQL